MKIIYFIFCIIIILLIVILSHFCITNHFRNFNELPYVYLSLFIKNNKLYIISPIYNNIIKNINVNINNENLLINDNFHTIKKSEPCQILIMNINNNNNKNCNKIKKITIKYDNKSHIIYRNPIYTLMKNKIAITTLFKHDYNLFNIFYNYYLNQGISHFYMYYNGKITNDIKNYFNKPNVTLIEWNFTYQNYGNNRHYNYTSNNKSKYRHHAQPCQMHDALYQYGKDNYEYMIFCDLDEYIYFPNFKIVDFVYNNHNIDWFKISSYYAATIDNKIPTYFPNKIMIDNEPHSDISKNIYKTNLIKTLGIHVPVEFIIDKSKINMNDKGLLLHFQSWNNKNTKHNCNTELFINN